VKKISKFEPNKHYLRKALFFCFNLKKTAAESHRMLVEAYRELALSETTCKEWFWRFKFDDFDTNDKNVQASKKIRRYRIASIGRWRSMSNIKSICRNVECYSSNHFQAFKSHQKNIQGRKMDAIWIERKRHRKAKNHLRNTACQAKKKGHRIVTSDKKWIYFDNPKHRKTICDPDQPSTSMPKRNIYGKKVMLCIWWDQKSVVYYGILRPGQTVTRDLYQQQIIRLIRAKND